MKSILFKIPLYFLLPLSILWGSCGQHNAYQKQAAMSGAQWNSTFMPEFTFEVTDTNARYVSQLLLRHDDSYAFSNIWIKFYLQHPSDSSYTDSFQRELILADNEGYWLGEEQGDMWVYRIPIESIKLSRFLQSGIYKVKMQQLMREDPLQSILNVGWRVDKQVP